MLVAVLADIVDNYWFFISLP